MTGTLHYGDAQVALATMPYRTVDLSHRSAEIEQELQTTPNWCSSCFLTLTTTRRKSHSSSGSRIYNVRLRGAWGGPAELFMIPHVGCPVAALPIVRVLEGRQHLWDMTLSDGEVVHDYLKTQRA